MERARFATHLEGIFLINYLVTHFLIVGIWHSIPFQKLILCGAHDEFPMLCLSLAFQLSSNSLANSVLISRANGKVGQKGRGREDEQIRALD